MSKGNLKFNPIYSFGILIFFGFLMLPVTILAQVYGDRSRTGGTGGNHSIQGKILFPSDKPATTMRVKLQSTNSTDLSTFSNSEGVFHFNSLDSGHYIITVEVNSDYEPMQEVIDIDREIQSTARTFNLIIYLRPKGSRKAKPGVLDASLAKVPKPALDQFKKGIEAENKGEMQAAINNFNEAIKLYEQFPEAYGELGFLYLKTNQLDRAVETLHKSLELDAKNSKTKLNYGIALLQKREMAEAAKELDEVVKNDSTSAVSHMYLGIALTGLRQLDKAEKELKQAIALEDNEKMAQAHKYLGGIYWGKQDYKQAANELEKYLKLAPKANDTEKIRATIKVLQNK